MHPILGLTTLPGDLVGALKQLGRLSEQLDDIAESTAVLPQVLDGISRVAADTQTLPALSVDMAGVAQTTNVLPPMEERMATIEAAMPTLVEVQQHLARLPETIDSLGRGLTELSALMGRLLVSMDGLDRNVEGLRAGIEPLGRIAERLPGSRR